MSNTPSAEEKATPQNVALLMALATVIVIGAAARTSVNFVDDALITLTYAKNLVQGNGFVYNVPPATFGTTSPLWTLMTAAVGVVAGADRLPSIALWLSALCWLGVVWVFFLGWRTWGLGRAGAAFVALLLATSSHPNLGMEQPVFQLLLLTLCLLTFRSHFFLAGLAGGLLFLARGEGALAVLLSGLCALYLGGGWRNWRGALANGLRLSAGFWLVVLPWLLYAWYNFGKILPDTLQSKMKQGLLPGYEQFQDALLRALVFEWPAEGIPLLPLHWALVLLGVYAVVRASGPLRWLFAWTVAYSLAYTVLHVADFWWYEIPVYWTWLICLAAGILHFPAAAPSKLRPRMNSLMLGFAAFIVVGRIINQQTGPGPQDDMHANIFRPAAVWIDAVAPKDATLGTPEVGYYGFHTSLQVVDQFGLITPEALEQDDPHDTAGFLRRFRPDFYALAHANDAPGPPPLSRFAGLGYRCVGRFAGVQRTAYVLASFRSERLTFNDIFVAPDSPALIEALQSNAPSFDDFVDYIQLNPAQRQRALGMLRTLRENPGNVGSTYDQIAMFLDDAQLVRFTWLSPGSLARIQLIPEPIVEN